MKIILLNLIIVLSSCSTSGGTSGCESYYRPPTMVYINGYPTYVFRNMIDQKQFDEYMKCQTEMIKQQKLQRAALALPK